jgi:putative two-component system response regulator
VQTWCAETARILIVDDNSENLFLLSELLKFAGYRNVLAETDSTEVLERIEKWHPDLVILDLHMPKLTGFDILALIHESQPARTFMPVLVCTADWTGEAKKKALDLGAWDFLTKPFDATELLLRVRNFLRSREMHVRVERQNKDLASVVQRRTKHVIRARTEALECLARAAEFRDDMTGEHARRVADMSGEIAQAIGLNKSTVELIRTAAPLHDIGKISISDSILQKPGRLTFEEYEIMKGHVATGGDIIGNVKSPQLRKAREIALYHHENWDGTGYPHGMSGSQIPVSARIVAVADTFDALISERPYKPAWPRSHAVEEVCRLSGTRFDPVVVEAFLKVCDSSEPHLKSVNQLMQPELSFAR